ncbi:MAG: hypothetical protein ACJ77K_14685 [Bacteroidia bacterium]
MFRILEIAWLFIGCICVLMCAYSIATGFQKDAIFFLVGTFMAGLMYAVRRKQRLKQETYKKEKEKKK